MEPLVLRKRLFLLSLAVGLVAIALLAAWVAMRHAEAVHHRGGRPRGNEWHVGYDPPVKRYVPPTAEEMRSYQEIARGIVSAYSNGQMSVLRELSERFLESACHLRYGDSSKAISPISQAWHGEHRRDKPLEEFATPDEFDHAMRMRMALTVIYGNFKVASKMGDNFLITLDFYTLLQLQEYESKFKREGKADFLAVAERLEAEWILQIESEKGFTREYMRSLKVLGRDLLEMGRVTEKDVSDTIRGCVYSLQKRCGYTPKWFVEEFPVIEEKK